MVLIFQPKHGRPSNETFRCNRLFEKRAGRLNPAAEAALAAMKHSVAGNEMFHRP